MFKKKLYLLGFSNHFWIEKQNVSAGKNSRSFQVKKYPTLNLQKTHFWNLF